jgi:anthranilate synthase component II
MGGVYLAFASCGLFTARVVVRPMERPFLDAPPGPCFPLAIGDEDTHGSATRGRWAPADLYLRGMAPRVLLVDNYDSFVYNLVQELGEIGADPVVYRNDAIDVQGIRDQDPDAIVISPGPGRPEDAGISLQVVEQLSGEIPILGVCLGHQCIGQAFGATIGPAPVLMHGKTSDVSHDGRSLFADLPNPLVATRYHSLVVDRATMPGVLEVTATDKAGVVMGIRHREMAVEGVQFHPESVLTTCGQKLLQNFLSQWLPTA